MKSWLYDNNIKMYSTHNDLKDLKDFQEQNLQIFDFSIK